MPNGTPPLEEFLHKETIGSLTGLSKRLADLDLIDEPRKLPPQLWPHVYLAMFASYLLRERKVRRRKDGVVWDLDDSKHPARRLIDSARDVFDANAAVAYDLQCELMDPTGDKEHRLHVLMYDHEAIEELEDHLLDRLGANRIRFPPNYAAAAARKRYPDVPLPEALETLKNDRRDATYRNLTQLLGINIADGEIRQALGVADDLDAFPDRDKHQSYGISRAVTEYLRGGGAKTLIRRARGPGFLWNKYWYRTTFGTRKHPGKFYNLLNESRNEIVIGTVLGTSCGYLVGKFGESIGPTLHDISQVFHDWGQVAFGAFGG